MNLFGIEIIPYTNFATKEDFAKALNKFALILKMTVVLEDSNYIVMVAYASLPYWKATTMTKLLLDRLATTHLLAMLL